MVGDHDVRQGKGCNSAVVSSDGLATWCAGWVGLLVMVGVVNNNWYGLGTGGQGIRGWAGLSTR